MVQFSCLMLIFFLNSINESFTVYYVVFLGHATVNPVILEACSQGASISFWHKKYHLVDFLNFSYIFF